jgi:hypothetical protein
MSPPPTQSNLHLHRPARFKAPKLTFLVVLHLTLFVAASPRTFSPPLVPPRTPTMRGNRFSALGDTTTSTKPTIASNQAAPARSSKPAASTQNEKGANGRRNRNRGRGRGDGGGAGGGGDKCGIGADGVGRVQPARPQTVSLPSAVADGRPLPNPRTGTRRSRRWPPISRRRWRRPNQTAGGARPPRRG